MIPWEVLSQHYYKAQEQEDHAEFEKVSRLWSMRISMQAEQYRNLSESTDCFPDNF
jgi:hypothetical protein